MPREMVAAQTDALGRIEVAWGRGTYAEIGTTLTPKTPGEPPAGNFVDLDRASINRLIRLLRKARDQAYGADA